MMPLPHVTELHELPPEFDEDWCSTWWPTGPAWDRASRELVLLPEPAPFAGLDEPRVDA